MARPLLRKFRLPTATRKTVELWVEEATRSQSSAPFQHSPTWQAPHPAGLLGRQNGQHVPVSLWPCFRCQPAQELTLPIDDELGEYFGPTSKTGKATVLLLPNFSIYLPLTGPLRDKARSPPLFRSRSIDSIDCVLAATTPGIRASQRIASHRISQAYQHQHHQAVPALARPESLRETRLSIAD
jgi:hypothetical protein